MSMISAVGSDFLLFCAGVFLNTSLVHLLNFEETRHHPMIRIWRSPKLGSSVWSVVQLFCGGLILLLLHYRFELSLETLFVVLGFIFWAILIGYWSGKRDEKGI